MSIFIEGLWQTQGELSTECELLSLLYVYVVGRVAQSV